MAELAASLAAHKQANQETGHQVDDLLEFDMGLSQEETDAYMASLKGED